MRLTKQDRQRFWSRVARRGHDECWLWLGGVSDNGYGQFDLNGSKIGAHRVAYAAVNGSPGRRVVRHSCDTPLCCNPAHLIAGTHQDNMNDRTRRGRGAVLVGEANGNTHIADALVVAIYLAVHRDRKTQAEVAKAFNVKPSMVFDIVHRRSRRSVTEDL